MRPLNVIFIYWFVCSFSIGVRAANFPADVNKCRIGDTECIKKEGNRLLRNLGGGHPGFNIQPLEPLQIGNINLKQGANKPVNVDLQFNNVKLHGLTSLQIYKVGGFGADPRGNYELRLKGPVLNLAGPYTISGRVLLLPIQGAGMSKLTLTNPDILVKFSGKTEVRNGKEYLTTNDLKLTFTITNYHSHFENLFKGDKALGESTNKFLNENWREIFNEIKPSVFNAFGSIVQNTIVKVFKTVPYKEFFSE